MSCVNYFLNNIIEGGSDMPPSWPFPSRAGSSPPDRSSVLCTCYFQGRSASTMCLRPPGLPSDTPPADELSQDHLSITNQRFCFCFFFFAEPLTWWERLVTLKNRMCSGFGPVPLPPLMVKERLSHIFRPTRIYDSSAVFQRKILIFPNHVFFHHFLMVILLVITQGLPCWSLYH